MATIVGGIATSHTPTIAFAKDAKKFDDPVWKPIFEGYEPVQAWFRENKPVNLSPELEAVTGKGPLTRAEVSSKVWAYIKANGVQDSVNKRNINPDGKLAEVTGKDQISMFKMTSAVSKHLS